MKTNRLKHYIEVALAFLRTTTTLSYLINEAKYDLKNVRVRYQ